MMTAFPIEQQEVAVGEQKHKECCVVSEGGWQGKYDGTIDYRKVLGEKERSWTRKTWYDKKGSSKT